jgi:chloramphenicol O-acetyltransferase type A
MKTIDLSTYPRRKHFDLYRSLDYPYFNLCAPVDITRFYAAVKDSGTSLTIAMTFLLARAANTLPEFRRRARGETLVEHEVVHPAPTSLGDQDVFVFWHTDFTPDYPRFAAAAQAAIDRSRQDLVLEDEPGRDDWLFMSAIPWVAFTSMSHPVHLHPADSVPRFSWGKFSSQGDRLSLPLSVQVNHAVMDGIHVGRYFDLVQAGLDQPDWIGG